MSFQELLIIHSQGIILFPRCLVLSVMSPFPQSARDRGYRRAVPAESPLPEDDPDAGYQVMIMMMMMMMMTRMLDTR